MKTLMIFIVILVIFSTIAIAISYFYVEKPLETAGISSVNITISCVDSNNVNIVCKYFLISNNQILRSSTTLQDGLIADTVNTNQTFDVLMENDSYYANKATFYNLANNKNIIVKLQHVGNVSLTYSGSLGDLPILNINTIGMIYNPELCLAWSNNILSAYIDNYTKIDDTINRFRTDKCYSLGSNLSTNLNFPINIRVFNTLNNDFVKVYLLDRDYSDMNLNVLNNSYNNSDFRALDSEIDIK